MKKKIKWKNALILLIIVVSSTMLIISVINILKWHKDNEKINKIIDKIYDVTVIEESADSTATTIVTPQKEVPKSDPYWDYIKMNLINVDFKKLKNINPDVVGWIKVNGTNINYPFVKTDNNSYYLNHTFDKSYNEGGWVFLDYRNNTNKRDQNTIIYAHGRTNKTMFGSLKDILSNNWINNSENYVIKLATESESTLWQIFSIYRIPTTNDYMRINFKNNSNFKEFADILLSRSIYDFKTEVSPTDHILTLSTCYDDYDKVVVHAKLIKEELKN